MDKLEKIRNIYDKEIRENNLEYYYLDKNKLCCDIQLAPMIYDLIDFDYLGPIKFLSKYYKDNDSNYYNELINRNNNLEKPIFIKDFDYDKDEILLQYIKCIKNMKILLFWPSMDIKNIFDSQITKFLETFGSIHAIKEINLTSKQMEGIIYQINYDKKEFKNLSNIQKFMNKIEADQSKNKIFVLFYSSDEFVDLENNPIILNQLTKIIPNNKQSNVDLNNYIKTINNFTNVIEISQLFCNKNSLRILQYQRLDRIFNQNFDKSLYNLMTFKNWMYQEINIIDQIRFLLVSGITLYALGLRQASDIDIIILPFPRENVRTENFFKLVDQYLLNSKTRFDEMEAVLKKEDGWYLGDVKYDYMKDWTAKEWPNLYGAKTMDETIIDPQFHYYYFGIKMIIPKAEIKRRIKRNRAAAYADLIAIMHFLKIEIDVPIIQKKYWSAHVFKTYDIHGIKKLYKTIKFYLKKRYDIDMNENQIKKYIKNEIFD